MKVQQEKSQPMQARVVETGPEQPKKLARMTPYSRALLGTYRAAEAGLQEASQPISKAKQPRMRPPGENSAKVADTVPVVVLEIPAQQEPAKGLLYSWKEIAKFFNRGIRTVQRWEKLLGLPIVRPDGRDCTAVVASARDLELWCRGLVGTDTSKREKRKDLGLSSRALIDSAEQMRRTLASQRRIVGQMRTHVATRCQLLAKIQNALENGRQSRLMTVAVQPRG